MRLKTTVFLVIIFVVIAGYFYLVEEKKREKAISKSLHSKILLPYTSDDIDRVILHNPYGDRIEWKRSGRRWLITYPTEARGDSAMIDYILSQIVPGRKMNEFDAEGNWSEYGLKPPYADIVLFSDRLSRADTIYIGDTTPLAAQCYIRLGSSPNVIVTRQLTRNLMQKKLYHLRRKEFLDIKPDSITGLSVIKGGSTEISLVKDEGTWLLRGSKIIADKALVVPYLASICQAIIREFAAEDTLDAEAFGIGDPQRELVLWAGDSHTRISFGKKKDDTVYVLRDGLPKIVLIESKYLQIFDWISSYALVMPLSSFSPSEVHRMTYSTPDTLITLERSARGWSSPADTSISVRSREVDYFMLALRSMAFEKLLTSAVIPEDVRSRGPSVEITLADSTGAVLDSIDVYRAPDGADIGESLSSSTAGIIRKGMFSEVTRIMSLIGRRAEKR